MGYQATPLLASNQLSFSLDSAPCFRKKIEHRRGTQGVYIVWIDCFNIPHLALTSSQCEGKSRVFKESNRWAVQEIETKFSVRYFSLSPNDV